MLPSVLRKWDLGAGGRPPGEEGRASESRQDSPCLSLSPAPSGRVALGGFLSVLPCKYITYEKTNVIKVKTQRNLTSFT